MCATLIPGIAEVQSKAIFLQILQTQTYSPILLSMFPAASLGIRTASQNLPSGS